jgi:tRNA(adenine34) deaminase
VIVPPRLEPAPHAPADETLAAIDRAMMERCLALALQATDRGEYPYAAVVCAGGKVVSESINSVRYDHNVTHHAEFMAISSAFRILNRVSLEDCTIYCNVEPCAFCCYAMRESRIGRVVYGVPAPLTGGYSRWNILADTELSDKVPEVFAPPPEIVAGFMREQIEAAIARSSPLVWDFISARNIFGGPVPSRLLGFTAAPRPQTFRDRLMAFLRPRLFDYFGRR